MPMTAHFSEDSASLSRHLGVGCQHSRQKMKYKSRSPAFSHPGPVAAASDRLTTEEFAGRCWPSPASDLRCKSEDACARMSSGSGTDSLEMCDVSPGSTNLPCWVALTVPSWPLERGAVQCLVYQFLRAACLFPLAGNHPGGRLTVRSLSGTKS